MIFKGDCAYPFTYIFAIVINNYGYRCKDAIYDIKRNERNQIGYIETIKPFCFNKVLQNQDQQKQ